MMFKFDSRSLLLVLFCFLNIANIFSQTSIDQNGVKMTVTNTLGVGDPNAYRYEIATVGYNSYHWQYGGIIIIELFDYYYGVGYDKYIVENGFGQGSNWGSPAINLVESRGSYHLAKVTLGPAQDTNTSFAGFVNRSLPIFVDTREYGRYKVRVTYLQDRVDELTGINQIIINENPTALSIPDFTVNTDVILNYNNSIILSNNLKISNGGASYIQNGNFGIGTTNPVNKLDVNGTIHSKEVKVDVTGWPDYVFENEYKLPSLKEVEKQIKDYGHLKDIPNTATVLENGIYLGEMNVKLLQKIEELMLYAIQQNKRIEALELIVKSK